MRALTQFLFRLSPRSLGWVALTLPFSVVLASIIFLHWRVDSVVREQLQEHMLRVGQLAAMNITPGSLSELAQGNETLQKQVTRRLTELQQTWPEIQHIDLWMRTGAQDFQIVFGIPGDPGGNDALEQDHYEMNLQTAERLIRTGRAWVADQPHDHKGRACLKVVSPLRQPGGEIIGYLSLDYRLSALETSSAALQRAALLATLIGLILCFIVSRLAENLRHMTLASIQERRKANEAMREALQQAEDARDARTEFLAIAAHDLKNPLSAIQGFCQLAERSLELDGGQEQAREKLSRINQTAGSLVHIVENLLASAALERSSFELNEQKFDWRETVEECIRLNQIAAQRKDITLIWQDPQSPMCVRGDRVRLFEAVDNLINNAVKYSPHGKQITVSLHRDNDIARLCVTDQGPGLTEDDHRRVFGQFQRLSAQPTGGESSLGLGLSIVKTIIEAHQGTVGVDSVAGQGAKFFAELPSQIEPECLQEAATKA